ncbi:hypothetical protein O181_042058 [Austropuccinia psidii MF-1]|uniref:Uncharacterized protein n=1 Tax=Austropuccinia psidii MF-1 TaxID=1389203 RepID=A0A9Q3HEE3_9BASI|nr:hypothetical protein [Austropuccinia psidii MF-1]
MEPFKNLKINPVAQEDVDTDTEFSDEIDEEELELVPSIQIRGSESTFLSPVQINTITIETFRSPQQTTRSPTRTSREPMCPEPESVFESCGFCNITGNVSDEKNMNKKVVTYLFAEVDALTEVFVDKSMKGAVPGEATRALARVNVSYEDGLSLVVKLKEVSKKFS